MTLMRACDLPSLLPTSSTADVLEEIGTLINTLVVSSNNQVRSLTYDCAMLPRGTTFGVVGVLKSYGYAVSVGLVESQPKTLEIRW